MVPQWTLTSISRETNGWYLLSDWAKGKQSSVLKPLKLPSEFQIEQKLVLEVGTMHSAVGNDMHYFYTIISTRTIYILITDNIHHQHLCRQTDRNYTMHIIMLRFPQSFSMTWVNVFNISLQSARKVISLTVFLARLGKTLTHNLLLRIKFYFYIFWSLQVLS